MSDDSNNDRFDIIKEFRAVFQRAQNKMDKINARFSEDIPEEERDTIPCGPPDMSV